MTKQTTQWKERFRPVRLWLISLLLGSSLLGAGADTGLSQTSPPPQVSAVSANIAWKFALLRLGVSASTPATEDFLTDQFGATTTEVQRVLLHGQRFLAAVNEIEQTARDEVARAYPLPPGTPRAQRSGTAEVFLPSGVNDLKSLLLRDGFVARVDSQREAVLVTLQQNLRGSLSADVYRRLDDWVNSVVRPRIRSTEPVVARNPPNIDLSKTKPKG